MDYVAVLNYSQYFKEPLPKDRLQYIRNYPTDFILMKLGHINAILFQDKDFTQQTTRILKVIFADTTKIDAELETIVTNARMDHQTFFSPAAISYMIKACLEDYIEEIPDQIVNPLQLAGNLFKTILIFNEIYYAQLHGYDLESFEGIFRLQIMQQNYIRGNVYLKLIISMKFAFISKFLYDHTYLKVEGLEYCKYFQLGNPWRFGNFFLEMLAAFSNNDPDAKFILDASNIPDRVVDDFTMNKAAIKGRKKISINMDVIPKPFYLLKDKDPLILDYNFFQFAIDQGFFYSLYHHTSLKNGTKFKDFNAFKGYIGLHYFEKYLVRQYMEAIFYRRNQEIVSTDAFQDFIVKPSSNTVFIFEVKMVDVHAKTIEEMDFERFKTFINENFLTEKTAPGEKNKGIYQIRKQLENLAIPESELRQTLGLGPANRLNVYPVIIYSDANLDLSGVNEYVNDHAANILQDFGKDFQTIRPVLMMNVNVLVEYFVLFKSNPATLAGLITGYFKSISNQKKRYRESKGPHQYLQLSKSFGTYLTTKVTADQLDRNLSEMDRAFNLDVGDFGAGPHLEQA